MCVHNCARVRAVGAQLCAGRWDGGGSCLGSDGAGGGWRAPRGTSAAVVGKVVAEDVDWVGGGASADRTVLGLVLASSVNSVPSGLMESDSWSWRMTTCSGISSIPSASALLDRMIWIISLVGFLPSSCRL